jgi:hypothetical protein
MHHGGHGGHGEYFWNERGDVESQRIKNKDHRPKVCVLKLRVCYTERSEVSDIFPDLPPCVMNMRTLELRVRITYQEFDF